MLIQILGAGAWGLAMARLLANAGHRVHIWARNPGKIPTLREMREDAVLLPGVMLPDTLVFSHAVVPAPDMVVYSLPSHALREVARRFSFPDAAIRVSATKGIENETLLRMSDVLISEGCRGPIVALSGPSHAEEIGRSLPACIVAASPNTDAARCVQQAFATPWLRVYTNTDIIGVELGGALKNVIAIASGACEGFGLGDNAKAALITRGLAEMIRLGAACGADRSTFSGLSGLGDLVVTCSSAHSRNRRVGELIARGMRLPDILASSPKVAEGIRTAHSVSAMAAKHGVEMPISDAVFRVLYRGHDPREAIRSLMARLMKEEWGV